MNLNLSFHDYIIQVTSQEESLLKKISDEFHFFVARDQAPPDATLNLHLSASPEMPSMVASKILENCVVYNIGSLKYVDYFGEALSRLDETTQTMDLYSLNQDRLYELAFLSIHSLLGQALDHKGVCRVHALAISYRQKNAIIMLPSKGGKSTLLTELIKNPDVKIISDDMPLIDIWGQVHPFPSKISLNSLPVSGPLAQLEWHEFKRAHYPAKWTASLSQLENRIDIHSRKNKNILIAGFRLSQGKSVLEKVLIPKMISPLLEHMVMGLGLPQIIELFLNFKITDLLKLGKHALMRALCAFQLARNAENYYFYMGPQIDLNAQTILDLINDQSNP